MCKFLGRNYLVTWSSVFPLGFILCQHAINKNKKMSNKNPLPCPLFRWICCLDHTILLYYLEVSEPKWVNHILNTIGFNSLRLGGLYSLNFNPSFYGDWFRQPSFTILIIKVSTLNSRMIWRPPSLSELTLMIFNMRLTHLCLEAFI